jgi:hypothetical protein
MKRRKVKPYFSPGSGRTKVKTYFCPGEPGVSEKGKTRFRLFSANPPTVSKSKNNPGSDRFLPALPPKKAKPHFAFFANLSGEK